jgi:hypothetical protein
MIAYDRLSQIVPAEQALAAKALATSLQTISGVTNMTLPTLANAVTNLQTTNNLQLVTALTQPVPSSVANVFIAQGGGTGDNGTVLLVDILGTVSGTVHTQALANTVNEFATMNLVSLTSTYTTMSEVVNGDYGDPVSGPVIIPSGPYAGTYANADVAFNTALISGAQSEISNVVLIYPTQVSTLNQNWIAMADQLVLEQTQQANANLNFSEIIGNSKSSIYGLVNSLPSYGLDIATGQVTEFLESVANLNILAGQSLVASLRQAINQRVLAGAGIQTNSEVPFLQNPPPAQANLIPGTYTESEAANLVIK